MFNAQAALKNGATPEQVLEYLGKSRGFNVEAAIKDGKKPQELIDFLSQQPAKDSQQSQAYQPETAEAQALAQPGKPGFGSFLKQDVLGAKPGEADGLGKAIFQNTLGSKGVSGFARSIGDTVATTIGAGQQQDVQKSRLELSQAADGFIKLAQQTQDPARKQALIKLAHQTLGEAQKVGDLGQEVAQATPNAQTPKEILGKAVNTATTLAPLAGGINPLTQGKVIFDQGLSAFAKTALAKGAQTGGYSALAGIGTDLASGASDKELGINAGLNFGVGAILSAAASGGKYAITRGVPRLLSYTANVPQESIDEALKNPKQVAADLTDLKTPKGQEKFLEQAQNATIGLRKELTQSYNEGKTKLAEDFAGQNFGLNEKERKIAVRIAKQYGIDIPQDMSNMSVKEGLELNAEINSLYDKRAIRESADGVIVRKFREVFHTKLIDSYGGKEGPLKQFLSNYSGEKNVFDSAKQLFSPYSRDKQPVNQATALGRLKAVWNENKGSYLHALQQLENATGVDLLGKAKAIAFLPIVQKDGNMTMQAIRTLLLPIIGGVAGTAAGGAEGGTLGVALGAALESPRAAGFMIRNIGRGQNIGSGVAGTAFKSGMKVTLPSFLKAAQNPQ